MGEEDVTGKTRREYMRETELISGVVSCVLFRTCCFPKGHCADKLRDILYVCNIHEFYPALAEDIGVAFKEDILHYKNKYC